MKDLNLEVVQGEVLGFLGLNGAGKTTAIRLLLDLLRPTSGKAFIFGHDCWTEGLAARARVGYLPGELGLYPDLTGFEVLDFLAGISRQAVDKRRRQELFDRLELPHSDLRRKLRQYSTGMKRKLGLIQAFQADPPLLILDEPTEGLDPLMQESFYVLLQDAKQKGRTVFMSSHVLSEVERSCAKASWSCSPAWRPAASWPRAAFGFFSSKTFASRRIFLRVTSSLRPFLKPGT